MESLASKMFGDVARGLQDVAKSLGQETPKEVEVDATAGADEVVADLDRRAQSGDITFDDFIVSVANCSHNLFDNDESHCVCAVPRLQLPLTSAASGCLLLNSCAR